MRETGNVVGGYFWVWEKCEVRGDRETGDETLGDASPPWPWKGLAGWQWQDPTTHTLLRTRPPSSIGYSVRLPSNSKAASSILAVGY